MYQLHHGDCLDVLPALAAGSIDAIICDPPYGTTACKWDSVIPFEPMWREIKRVLKPRGACVLFGSQPFTSALVMSNPGWFRYSLVWDKVNKYTGALNANRQPLRRHEDIAVFARGLTIYNKQYRDGAKYKGVQTKGHGSHTKHGNDSKVRAISSDGRHNPCSVLCIPADNKTELGLHPTQKPLALLEYLVRTYTNEGDTVLDFTMGSGTTGHAAANTGRSFIGIERDEHYFAIASERIAAAYAPLAAMERAS